MPEYFCLCAFNDWQIYGSPSTEDLKIYTIYSPPHHRDGIVHKTKNDAETDDEEFDGVTTE